MSVWVEVVAGGKNKNHTKKTKKKHNHYFRRTLWIILSIKTEIRTNEMKKWNPTPSITIQKQMVGIMEDGKERYHNSMFDTQILYYDLKDKT